MAIVLLSEPGKRIQYSARVAVWVPVWEWVGVCGINYPTKPNTSLPLKWLSRKTKESTQKHSNQLPSKRIKFPIDDEQSGNQIFFQ